MPQWRQYKKSPSRSAFPPSLSPPSNLSGLCGMARRPAAEARWRAQRQRLARHELLFADSHFCHILTALAKLLSSWLLCSPCSFSPSSGSNGSNFLFLFSTKHSSSRRNLFCLLKHNRQAWISQVPLSASILSPSQAATQHSNSRIQLHSASIDLSKGKPLHGGCKHSTTWQPLNLWPAHYSSLVPKSQQHSKTAT